MKRLEETINPAEVDLSGFNLKSELNQRLWKNMKLDPMVRLSLLTLAYEFIKDAKLPFVNDIIMTGSLANYNWNEAYSDIDLHVVVDFKDLADNTAMLKAYCDEKKKNWNNSHENITMLGYPVELYIQDLREPHKSTGVYSLLKNDWLAKPSLDKLPHTADDEHVKHGVAAYCNSIDALIATANDPEIVNNKEALAVVLRMADELHAAIKQERKESMDSNKYAELTTGNLIFKSLRRNGYIEKLVELKRKCFDKTMSL